MRRAPSARTPRATRRRRSSPARLSRKRLSENICASSDRSCRCCSVACSGTSSTNTCPTGLPSGASNGIGDLRRTKAPSASFRPLIRPWGIAMPWPRPVEPSFSRARRLSTTILRGQPAASPRTARRRRRTGAPWTPRRGRAGCLRPAASRRSGSSAAKDGSWRGRRQPSLRGRKSKPADLSARRRESPSRVYARFAISAPCPARGAAAGRARGPPRWRRRGA